MEHAPSPGPLSAKDLFLDALEMPEEQRADFLRARTPEQPVLRAAAQALLDAHEELSAESGSGQSTLGGVSGLPTGEGLFAGLWNDLEAGQIIGPFTLQREIGRGGLRARLARDADRADAPASSAEVAQVRPRYP